MKKIKVKKVKLLGLFFLIWQGAYATTIDKADLTIAVKGANGSTIGRCFTSSLQACPNTTQCMVAVIPPQVQNGSIQITNNSTSVTATNIQVYPPSSNPDYYRMYITQSPSSCTLTPGSSCTIVFSNNNIYSPAFTVSNIAVHGTNTNTSCFTLSSTIPSSYKLREKI